MPDLHDHSGAGGFCEDEVVSKPEVSKPEVSKPEVSKPEVSKPEVSKPASGDTSDEDLMPKHAANPVAIQKLRRLVKNGTISRIAKGRSFGDFENWRASWSRAQFGSRGPIGPLKHLAREAEEAIKKPQDIKEYADALHLVLDANDRAGFTIFQLLDASFGKLQENILREWPETVGDEPTEHVRELTDHLGRPVESVEKIVVIPSNSVATSPAAQRTKALRTAMDRTAKPGEEPKWGQVFSELQSLIDSPPFDENGTVAILHEIANFKGELQLDESSPMPHRMSPENMMRWLASRALSAIGK